VIVHVLFFAGARDAVGCAEEERELPAEVKTAGDFLRFIAGAYPALAGRMSTIRVARNERFVEADEPLDDGDVLALIPPVAGG
jgi:molybdopterin converting factor subunit 1